MRKIKTKKSRQGQNVPYLALIFLICIHIFSNAAAQTEEVTDRFILDKTKSYNPVSINEKNDIDLANFDIDEDPILQAGIEGDYEKLKSLINANSKLSNEYPILHILLNSWCHQHIIGDFDIYNSVSGSGMTKMGMFCKNEFGDKTGKDEIEIEMQKYKNYEKIVKLILEKDSSNINKKDDQDCTPMEYAVLLNHKDICDLLIRYGANSQDNLEELLSN